MNKFKTAIALSIRSLVLQYPFCHCSCGLCKVLILFGTKLEVTYWFPDFCSTFPKSTLEIKKHAVDHVHFFLALQINRYRKNLIQKETTDLQRWNINFVIPSSRQLTHGYNYFNKLIKELVLF